MTIRIKRPVKKWCDAPNCNGSQCAYCHRRMCSEPQERFVLSMGESDADVLNDLESGEYLDVTDMPADKWITLTLLVHFDLAATFVDNNFALTWDITVRGQEVLKRIEFVESAHR